jgi:ubiquitin carboxyl-terminal hydrolase 3
MLEAVWKFVPKFKNYQQQDAEEFLVYLLDRLHYELTVNPINGPLSQQALMKAKSIITDIFQGKLLSEVWMLCIVY